MGKGERREDVYQIGHIRASRMVSCSLLQISFPGRWSGCQIWGWWAFSWHRHILRPRLQVLCCTPSYGPHARVLLRSVRIADWRSSCRCLPDRIVLLPIIFSYQIKRFLFLIDTVSMSFDGIKTLGAYDMFHTAGILGCCFGVNAQAYQPAGEELVTFI